LQPPAIAIGTADLEILAEAARMFSDARFREQLRASADAAEVYRLFGTWTESAT
jgi:mannitol/fructose-specific phosphotransferase system IIA component (Ntr-type)